MKLLMMAAVVEWLQATEPSGEGAVNFVVDCIEDIGGGGGGHCFVHFDEISEILDWIRRRRWLSRGRFSWIDWQKIDIRSC